MYRVVSDTDSVKVLKPLRGEGRETPGQAWQAIYIHPDQREVSPDGKLLYDQPCSGPMSVIETVFLNDPKLSYAVRAKHDRTFINNGTAIDRQGNVYVSDADHSSVLKITPSGKVSTLVHDPRLIWVDAMWITSDGRLWMPAAQMDRTPDSNNGRLTVQYPIQVFTSTSALDRQPASIAETITLISSCHSR
jgi:hypothetical protein